MNTSHKRPPSFCLFLPVKCHGLGFCRWLGSLEDLKLSSEQALGMSKGWDVIGRTIGGEFETKKRLLISGNGPFILYLTKIQLRQMVFKYRKHGCVRSNTWS